MSGLQIGAALSTAVEVDRPVEATNGSGYGVAPLHGKIESQSGGEEAWQWPNRISASS